MPNPNGSSSRSPREVFEDHLDLSLQRDYQTDAARNYAPDAVTITGAGILRGRDGVIESRRRLSQDLPDGEIEFLTKLVEGEIAFLEWRGESEGVTIDDGADGFVIRDGLIRAQTIHYTVRHRTGYHEQIRKHPV